MSRNVGYVINACEKAGYDEIKKFGIRKNR